MEPSGFEQANTNLGPPSGLSEDVVHTLRVYRGYYPDGTPIVISKWKPTQEELAVLNSGGGLFLHIWGGTMPPVSLTTDDPFIRGSE